MAMLSTRGGFHHGVGMNQTLTYRRNIRPRYCLKCVSYLEESNFGARPAAIKVYLSD